MDFEQLKVSELRQALAKRGLDTAKLDEVLVEIQSHDTEHGAPAGEEYPSTAEKRQRADDSDVSAKKPRTDGHDEITVVIECPHVKVGLVIGKAGSVLKELHEITGATVKVAPWDEVSVMRVVQIKGSPQAIAKAKTLVGEKTGVPEESMPLLPDRPEAFNASARHSQGASRGQPIARSFLVPNEHVGAIIGKQGLTLKEFRETSKAQIQVEKNCAVGTNMRPVMVSGTIQECAHAEMLLIQKLATCGANLHAMAAPQANLWGGLGKAGTQQAQQGGQAAWGALGQVAQLGGFAAAQGMLPSHFPGSW